MHFQRNILTQKATNDILTYFAYKMILYLPLSLSLSQFQKNYDFCIIKTKEKENIQR